MMAVVDERPSRGVKPSGIYSFARLGGRHAAVFVPRPYAGLPVDIASNYHPRHPWTRRAAAQRRSVGRFRCAVAGSDSRAGRPGHRYALTGLLVLPDSGVPGGERLVWTTFEGGSLFAYDWKRPSSGRLYRGPPSVRVCLALSDEATNVMAKWPSNSTPRRTSVIP